MSLKELEQLEAEFKLTLPKEYKKALLQPFISKNNLEFELDLAELRRNNLEFRDTDPWEFPWSDQFWWIGADGAGGFYFIDCKHSECEVLYFDHEAPAENIQDREQLHPQSLEDFFTYLKESELEAERYKENLLNKINNRKWWQIWIPRKLPPWMED